MIRIIVGVDGLELCKGGWNEGLLQMLIMVGNGVFQIPWCHIYVREIIKILSQ
jgi:hypothetical protein